MKYNEKIFNTLEKYLQLNENTNYSLIHNKNDNTMYVYCWNSGKKKSINFLLKQIGNQEYKKLLTNKDIEEILEKLNKQ